MLVSWATRPDDGRNWLRKWTSKFGNEIGSVSCRATIFTQQRRHIELSSLGRSYYYLLCIFYLIQRSTNTSPLLSYKVHNMCKPVIRFLFGVSVGWVGIPTIWPRPQRLRYPTIACSPDSSCRRTCAYIFERYASTPTVDSTGLCSINSLEISPPRRSRLSLLLVRYHSHRLPIACHGFP